MKDILFWTGTLLLQLLIYLLPSVKLEKGKWIRKHTASASLSGSVVPMQGLRSKEVDHETHQHV